MSDAYLIKILVSNMNKFKHFLKRNNLINKFAFRISGGLGDQILMLSFFYD
jgi:hypothetical protein